MPTRAKQAFELKEMAGMNINEIASVMKISTPVVKNHLRKARNKIRVLVAEQYN